MEALRFHDFRVRFQAFGFEALECHDFRVWGFRDVHVYVYMSYTSVMRPGADPYFLDFKLGLWGLCFRAEDLGC